MADRDQSGEQLFAFWLWSSSGGYSSLGAGVAFPGLEQRNMICFTFVHDSTDNLLLVLFGSEV